MHEEAETTYKASVPHVQLSPRCSLAAFRVVRSHWSVYKLYIG